MSEQSEQIGELAASLANAQERGGRHLENEAIFAFARHFRGSFSNQKAPRLLDAFFERVAFGMSDCWYWTGGRSDIGYGVFASARKYYGVPEIMAHRISWHLFNGPIDAEIKVLHRCDVRACVNPDHLFLGSQADNVADMVRKGRAKNARLFGEKNPMAKLTAASLLLIKEERAAGMSQRAIACKHGVSVMTINRALRGISWRNNERS